MTGRAVFGDFIVAARRHLGSPGSFREAVGQGGSVPEISHSLLRIVLVMGRYVQDVDIGPAPVPGQGGPALTGWDRAGAEAREALTSAAVSLYGDPVGGRRPGATAGSEIVRRLNAASASLTYGRDLLHTHLARGPRGGRQLRSEWGEVITAPPLTWALLAEMGSLAHQLAPLGPGLAHTPGAHGSPEARRRLNAACQCLQNAAASIRIAQRHEPVSAADRDLLHAVPINAVPLRRLPDGSEPVTTLCEGVTATAERARHAAWASSMQPAWSPDMTVDSLRQVAAASTVTSHHCEILLRSLATRAGGAPDGFHARLLQAADAAGRTRTRWLRVVHALDQVTTDTQGLSQTATAASDLALWSGRLAYCDPQWTLASKPSHQARPPHSLAPEPDDIPRVTAAIYHACDTMASLAQANRKQIRAAARAERFLVPTESQPGAFDILLPFTPASPDHIDAMLTLYQFTSKASAEAADTIPAPGHAIIRSAANARRHDASGKMPNGASAKPGLVPEPWHAPGPIQRTLRGLGVTNPDLLQRGADIDRAGEQLIIDATTERIPQPERLSAASRGRTTGTTLDDPARVSGNPRTAALLHRKATAQREAPEAEP